MSRTGFRGDRQIRKTIKPEDISPWTATADEILERVRRGRAALDAITN